MNPNVLTVTGRPQYPRDQGSVESMNKFVKRVLGSVLAEWRLAGDSPNWTKVLGSVAAAINSQQGHGKNDVSSYEAVFGQVYDHDFLCTKEEIHKCWTLSEEMCVTNNAEFASYVEEHFDIGNNEGRNVEDDDSSYFSDGELLSNKD